MPCLSHVTLVAVSKTKSLKEISQAYEAGQRIFGENKIQCTLFDLPKMPVKFLIPFIGFRNFSRDISFFVFPGITVVLACITQSIL